MPSRLIAGRASRNTVGLVSCIGRSMLSAPAGAFSSAEGASRLSCRAMAAGAPSESPDRELEETAWDLQPLLDGEGPEGVERRLEDALEQAQAFAARYAGKLGDLDGAVLQRAMQELAGIYELLGRAGTYAMLRFSTDTAEPANGALLQLAQERATAIETTLLFCELEWAALAEERAEELLAGEGLDFARHHLRNVRRYRDHLLSAPA